MSPRSFGSGRLRFERSWGGRLKHNPRRRPARWAPDSAEVRERFAGPRSSRFGGAGELAEDEGPGICKFLGGGPLRPRGDGWRLLPGGKPEANRRRGNEAEDSPRTMTSEEGLCPRFQAGGALGANFENAGWKPASVPPQRGAEENGAESFGSCGAQSFAGLRLAGAGILCASPPARNRGDHALQQGLLGPFSRLKKGQTGRPCAKWEMFSARFSREVPFFPCGRARRARMIGVSEGCRPGGEAYRVSPVNRWRCR